MSFSKIPVIVSDTDEQAESGWRVVYHLLERDESSGEDAAPLVLSSPPPLPPLHITVLSFPQVFITTMPAVGVVVCLCVSLSCSLAREERWLSV